MLICELLESRRPPRLGRVVCLGSPLKGSRTAARLVRWPGGQRLIGRCLAEVHARGGFACWPPGVEVGSVAGRTTRTEIGGFTAREGQRFAVLGSGLVNELTEETPDGDIPSAPTFCNDDQGSLATESSCAFRALAASDSRKAPRTP